MNPSKVPVRLAVTLLCLLAAACSSGGPPEPAAAPDEAHDRIMRGLADHRPEVLWDALPASYQADVEGMVHQTADMLDEELWTKSCAVLQKTTRVLREKKEFILQNPLVAMQLGSGPEVAEGWDTVVGALDELVHSELAELDRMRTLDVREFLSGTGQRLLEAMAEAETLMPDGMTVGGFDSLRETTATISSQEGDRATLEIDSPDEGPSREVWVRLEGKWIPEEWTEDWDGRIEEMRRGLAEISSEMDPADRQQALMRLAMVDGILDRLLAAENADDFNAALGGAFGMIMGAMG